MQTLNLLLEQLSTAYLGGIPVDRVATVVAVLMSYAMAHLFRLIPAKHPYTKHMFSIMATAFLFGAVQEQTVGLTHLTAGSLGLYLIMLALESSHLMPYVVFVLAMLHMSYSQIRRQLSESSGQVVFDYTGAQMIFVIKVTSLAFCISDGKKDAAELSEYQKRNVIEGVPSLTEYLGYVFFFPGFAVGPAFEMATYRRMICFEGTPFVWARLNIRAYKTLLAGLFWMVVYVLYGNEYTFTYMVTPSFAQLGFLHKVAYMCLSGVVTRAAYYTAWKMSEGACALAGLGYDGIDEKGEIRWTDISNVHIMSVEFGSSIKELIDSWNVGTNTWLRHHVYLRIAAPGKGSSFKATVLTFLVSAWWHGFYPGYYLTFFLGSLASNAARTLRRTLHRPVVEAAAVHGPWVKQAYDIAGWMMSMYTLDFVAVPFMVLAFMPSLQAWQNNYFVLPVGLALVYVLFNVVRIGRFIPKSNSHDVKHGGGKISLKQA
ncbi:Lysophospholipid acyltransferase [Coemansia interrupta]|uniref:Lysophospholipid acyltransferase n=1 Tax=Coemansia interrupta TaxID=1126814 RepID=A0A9W8H9I9_9FUNG|nr:Lysophospholipid acyltransferase [Coemansia interrupta]